MMHLELTGGTLAITYTLIGVALVAMIYLVRSFYNRRTDKALRGEYANRADDQSNRLMDRVKYSAVNVFGLSSTFFNFGLALAIGLSFLAFGWTQYSGPVVIPAGALEMLDDIEQVVPRTPNPPPPPPPPPPPVIEAIPDAQLLEEEPPEFVDLSIDAESVMQEIAEAAVIEDPGPPPPPPPPPVETEPPIWTVVEYMPMFAGCDEDLPYPERKICADKELLTFVYDNIKYPQLARGNNIEGRAVVSFVVEKDGSVTDIEILRDPGGGIGKEVVRVINLMNEGGTRWIPGVQGGRNVRVRFTMPVIFRLD